MSIGTDKHREATPDQQSEPVPDEKASARLCVVIVTFRRKTLLTNVLGSLRTQSLAPALTIVVDNDNDPAVAELVESFESSRLATYYIASSENVGPAGGTAIAMDYFAHKFGPSDWLMRLDDDKPLEDSTILEEMLRFAVYSHSVDPRTGGVGLAGGRYDPRRARLSKISVYPEQPMEPADYLATNFLATFRHTAISRVGYLNRALFFGMSEVEYGLRLKAAGVQLWLHADKVMERRPDTKGLAVPRPPSKMIDDVDWRRYYSLRNSIYVAYRFGGLLPAVRVAAVRGIGKSLYNLSRPRVGFLHLWIAMRAIADAALGRMGKRIDPLEWETKRKRLDKAGDMRPTR